ncbi:MAG: hypothetical protein Q9222_007721 [Ikaeria aurantiellina]
MPPPPSHSHSPARKPPSPLLTRIFLRLRDTADEYLERSADHAAGRRDKMGRKTDAWYEHDFQRQRRAKGRDEKRKKREERRRLKGKEEGMMTGGREEAPSEGTTAVEGGGGSRAGGGSHAGGGGSHAGGGGSHAGGGGHAGGSRMEAVSPMPSEHSYNSTGAQVHERKKDIAAKDSEDEDPVSSDDGSRSDDEEGKKAKEPSGGAAAGGSRAGSRAGGSHASGIRGGGHDNDNTEEYNEHEDFDDEYANAEADEPTIIASPEFGKPEDKGSKDLEETAKGTQEQAPESINQNRHGKLPGRTPQTYALSGIRENIGIRPTKTTEKPEGLSRENEARRAEKGKRTSKPKEVPQAKSKAKKAAKPEQHVPQKTQNGPKVDRDASYVGEQMQREWEKFHGMPDNTYYYGAGSRPHYRYGGPPGTARPQFAFSHHQEGPPEHPWRTRSNAHYELYDQIRFAGFSQRPAYEAYTGGILNLDDSRSEVEAGSIPDVTSDSRSRTKSKPKRRGRPAADFSSEDSTSSSDEDSEPSKPPKSRRSKPKPKRRRSPISSEETTSSEDPTSDSIEKSEPTKTRRSRHEKSGEGKGKKQTSKQTPPPDYDDVVDAPPNHYERLGLSEKATAEESVISLEYF